MLDINELTNGVRKSFSNQSTLGKPARAPSPRLEPLVGAAANDASESASKHAAKQVLCVFRVTYEDDAAFMFQDCERDA